MTHLHISVPAITRGTLARPHELTSKAKIRRARLGKRGGGGEKKCLSPAHARFSHFFFTDFVTTISEPGTGYGRPGVPSRCQSALQSLLAGYNSPKLFRTEANGDVPLDGVAFSRLD